MTELTPEENELLNWFSMAFLGMNQPTASLTIAPAQQLTELQKTRIKAIREAREKYPELTDKPSVIAAAAGTDTRTYKRLLPLIDHPGL